MTDDIRPVAESPVDLLVVGGLTVDVLDGREAAGGAARYAVEGALAAGLRVAMHTVSGEEGPVRALLGALPAEVLVTRQAAQRSIRFEHHGAHDRRRLRLAAQTDPMDIGAMKTPNASAVLFAPVAGEVGLPMPTGSAARVRAAGLQGWLRIADADGWVQPRRLSDLDPDLAAALRDLDLLIASEDDIGEANGVVALTALRAWAGPGPELVVTAGADGAWLDAGSGPPAHVPAQVVEGGRHTIGAGDAFSAVLTARRGAGDDLAQAASAAAAATAAYLASRPQPITGGEPGDSARGLDVARLDGTSWRARRFGPGLAETPPQDAEFSLDVADGRVSGQSGCNRYMGGWTLANGVLTVGPLASTMMYCSEPLMRLEGVFLAALQVVSSLTLDGETLSLLDPSGDPLVELTGAFAADGAPA